jgi:tRNA(adenine34) deaminase
MPKPKTITISDPVKRFIDLLDVQVPAPESTLPAPDNVPRTLAEHLNPWDAVVGIGVAPEPCELSPVNFMSNSDEIGTPELWMEEALRAAQRAFTLGEVPVGAIVVRDGQIVGRGWNCPISANDPTAHAEILALREAGRAIGNYRLGDCDLYVTIEPCAMCAGAITHARIKRLVYGADDPKAGAVHSAMQVLNHPQLNHRVEVTSGVLAARATELVQAFFRTRRTK